MCPSLQAVCACACAGGAAAQRTVRFQVAAMALWHGESPPRAVTGDLGHDDLPVRPRWALPAAGMCPSHGCPLERRICALMLVVILAPLRPGYWVPRSACCRDPCRDSLLPPKTRVSRPSFRRVGNVQNNGWFGRQRHIAPESQPPRGVKGHLRLLEKRSRATKSVCVALISLGTLMHTVVLSTSHSEPCQWEWITICAALGGDPFRYRTHLSTSS